MLTLLKGGRGPLFALLMTLLPSLLITAHAASEYLSQEAFLSQAFGGGEAEKGTLWLKGDLKSELTELMGERYPKLRVRYWLQGARTAWILESIGKDQPITFGYVVENNAIVQAKVLVFREHRGWEIHRDAFTKQYHGVSLEDSKLSDSIDGISGATLSVYAMNRTAKMALFLAEHVTQ
ncbi:FMN-binding domain-containing protein [Ferrimonas sediminum]|uniref:FMN-binding domain-containing protein n=1 Tax=Ferrimonas sediminum TaxID=718193 RepID=A0A1G8QB46_9GAMM|nr:FMN-binding protein [Ferrimonas sediminum]SDJ01921.1 FMN-binding domain-containing protein [Ferrimonas sediminum]